MDEKPPVTPDSVSDSGTNAPPAESMELAGAPVVPEAAAQPEPTAHAAAAAPSRPSEGASRRGRGARPELTQVRDPVYREAGGYRLKLEPPDLARLRELPGSKGKTDQELGEQFLEAHAGRLTAALAGDVSAPAEIRVVVDPFSRQAFLALDNKIRGILSF